MNKLKKPELLAPAGDFNRLKYAVMYGADAVYLAGEAFGMRTAPKNFSIDELKNAVEYAHEHGVKVYLTVNTLPRNGEISVLKNFLLNAASSNVDAFIISDLGVMSLAKQYAPQVEIHVSTQHGVVNFETANVLYNMGAKRIVPARELSLSEIAEISKNIPQDMDIEAFVHGAMCVSFSGRCLLSNYMTGRDSNRGDCAQPCRWKYHLMEESRDGQFFPVEENDRGTFIFNSKDMCMIEHIPELVSAGVTSFKIEGRAKSEHYVAVVTNAYRMAIDEYFKTLDANYKPPQWIVDEVYKVSFRDYCTGFYFNSPMEDANISTNGGYIRFWDVVGIVEESKDGKVFATQRNRFFDGDEVEIVCPKSEPIAMKICSLQNESGEAIDTANHPMMKFSFDCSKIVPPGSFIRKKRQNPEVKG